MTVFKWCFSSVCCRKKLTVRSRTACLLVPDVSQNWSFCRAQLCQELLPLHHPLPHHPTHRNRMGHMESTHHSELQRLVPTPRLR